MSRYNLPIVWPKDFIEKVREWAPGDFGLQNLTKDGGDFILRVLDGARMYRPSNLEILKAFEDYNVQAEIKERIKKAMEAEELLKEGYKIAEPFMKYPLK